MEKKFEIFSNSPTCPIRNVFDRFGDKWSVLVLMVLGTHGGLMRFGELKEVIDDITQKMLTVTLRTLEADGLVARKYYQEIPPRVEYQLTDLGKSLVPHIEALAHWGSQHVEQILKSRKRFEKKAANKD
jgi:DNA-binding HxlR family transcriptional regulator